ncbi:lipopolysaccharide biosynthesis protein [Sphingobacterium hungaricum]
MLKKLLSHTAIYGLAPQVIKIAQFLVLPIITPYLSPTDYGIFGLIVAIIGAVSVFGSLGLNIVLANSFTRSTHQYKWLWRQIYGFLNLWNIIYTLIVALLLYLFIPKEAYENTYEIILLNVIPLVLFAPSTSIGTLYFQMMSKPFQIASRSIVIGLLTIALNIYFIKYLHMGYMGWFWSGAITQVLFQLSFYIPLNYKIGLKPIYNFKWDTIKKQLKICLPTIPHYYSSYLLNSFDRVIMKFYNLDIVSIGRYNAAQTVGNFLNSATYAANQAISPLLLNVYKTDDKETEQRLNFSVMILFLVGTSTLCLFLKELLPLLIKSDGLENIYSVAIIIAMAYNYRPMYVAANNKLFYVEKTKALLKVTTIASIISVILNLIFIKFFGYTSAAITLYISLMYMGYSGFFIKEFKQMNGTNHYPVFWLCLTISLTVFVFFAVELNFWIKIFIGLALLIVALLGLLKVNKVLKL